MPDKNLLAMGDPVYEKPGSVTVKGRPYARLEYSGEEVRNIASLFKNDNSEIFLRDSATEANLHKALTQGNYSYIHFATHGYINEDEPDLSGLVLTKSESSSDDGILQSTEIFDLNLRTGLVVLSACQTGLGKLVRGEGIVGLSRAFMYAGAPSVLVSLWSVSDNSTAVLMDEFYRNLIKSGLYKTDALRKAQLSLLSNEEFAHPFYWAPFVLFGDWK
jgi:CHAT domain-containing protein